MKTRIKVIKNTYRDSVSLMQIAKSVGQIDKIDSCSVNMGTPSNLSLLNETGYDLTGHDFDPNDLIVAIMTSDENAKERAFDLVDTLLTQKKSQSSQDRQILQKSLSEVKKTNPEASLALISIAGEYAVAEAYKALGLDMNVMLFSDNISIEDERALKEFANEQDKIVMGPDCGTAIIDGIPLAFANVVEQGSIGLVAASGTGLQEVTTLISNLGGGITQAIGTGGHDLSADVGGISMLKGISMLRDDNDTKVIVLISKPPSNDIAKKVLSEISQLDKPIVICFLGGDSSVLETYNKPTIHWARDLETAALLSLELSGIKTKLTKPAVDIKTIQESLSPAQKYIRGLFSGGTFCYEATLIMQAHLDTVYSNTCVGSAQKIENFDRFDRHTLVDLGDDHFTRGRPHPMIDLTLRNDQILKEAHDPNVAVILLDLVIGYGAHDNPAKELAPVLNKAQQVAKEKGNRLVFVVHVCGTENDPQVLSSQIKLMESTGAIIASSNVQAVNIALNLVGVE